MYRAFCTPTGKSFTMSLIAIAKREQLRTLPWGIPSTREKVSERVFWILVWKVLSERKFFWNTAR